MNNLKEYLKKRMTELEIEITSKEIK